MRHKCGWCGAELSLAQKLKKQLSEIPLSEVDEGDFSHVQAGDTVLRRLGPKRLPMFLDVTKVVDGLIHAIRPEVGGDDPWLFDVATGIEVDYALGWGPDEGVTGSYLDSDYGLKEG